MHALFFRGRKAAKVSLRSQNQLKRAFEAVIEPLEERALLSAGDADTAFGNVFTNFNMDDRGGIVLRLSSGKLLQVGSTLEPDAVGSLLSRSFALARFNADGSPDLTFAGGSNTSVVDLPNEIDYSLQNVSGAAIDGNGRIVVVGTVHTYSTNGTDWVVAAFTPGGTLDGTFGNDAAMSANDGNGIVVSDFIPPIGLTTDSVNEGRAVAIDSSPGRENFIVVAGSMTADVLAGGEGFGVARYDTNGVLDTSFSGNGWAVTRISGSGSTSSSDLVHAVAIQADGSIVLAGDSTTDSGAPTPAMFAVQRYTANGDLDISFGGGDGSVTTPIGDVVATIFSVAIDTSGSIVAAGTAIPTGEFVPMFAMARYTSSGSLDSSFGTSGVVTTNPSGDPMNPYTGSFTDVKIQDDGKILAAGSVGRCGDSGCNFAEAALGLARYSSGGTLDIGFAGGIVFTTFQEGFSTDRTASIAIQPELSKVVVGGTSHQTFALSHLERQTGEATATTPGPHGLNAGDTITISGSNPEEFRGTYSIDSTPAPDSFTYANPGVDGPASDAGYYSTADVDFLLNRFSLGGTVSNVAPTVTINGAPASSPEGTTIHLTSTVTDPDSSSFTYAWSVTKNGSPFDSGSSANFNFTPDDNAAYVVSLTVTDDTNLTGNDSKSITGTNVAPTIAISGNASVNEGSSYSLTLGAVTDPGTDTVTSYIVHWGDGNTNTYPSNGVKTHTYADGPASSPITVDLIDEDGTFTDAANAKSVTVNNVAPSIVISGGSSLNEGGTYTLTLGAVTDPGQDTVSSYIVHWGDGNTNTYSTTGNKTHTYADGPSSNAITVDLVDEDGTFTNRANALSVSVNNVAPTIAISGAGSVNEGSSYSLTLGAVSDPGADTVSSYIVHWGDGATNTFSSNGVKTHTYVEGPNSYNITVDLVDEDGTFLNRANALAVTVNNVAPSVAAISGPSTGVRDYSQTFSSSFTDPGAVDTWTVTWNFGDGNTVVGSGSPGALSKSHTYVASGTYTVTLTVADDDGGSSSKTKSITISDAAVVDDGNGTPVLQVSGTGGANDIKVNPSGQLVTDGVTRTFTGFEYILVKAGAGNDTVKVHPNVIVTVIVFGGPGDDSIKGGAGDDILIGGDGADLLQGSDGRDILIGGDGPDRIVGNADDDILVAGYSSYDSNIIALRAIQSEWVMQCNSSRCDYGQRSANILNQDVAISGHTYHKEPTFDEDPIFLAHRNNGDFYLAPDGAGATVSDDGDQDIMTGNQGSDLFLFNAEGPVSDIITDLNSTEFAADIDFINSI